MQLLVLVLNKTECLGKLLNNMVAAGFTGATVVDSKGMLRLIGSQSVEPPPIFGSLRQFLNPEHESNKTLFIVVEDEKIASLRKIINDSTGGLGKPDTGIAFAMPLSFVEGLR